MDNGNSTASQIDDVNQILDGLDEIDWEALRDCYGPAIKVPEAIRYLASDDEEDRLEGNSILYSNVSHQGTVYEVTAYAVPFLIKLLECKEVEEKDQILEMLEQIAAGNSDPEAHSRRATEAVRKGRKVYTRLLDSEDESIRTNATKLLLALASRQ